MKKDIFSYFTWLGAVIAVMVLLFWFFGLRNAPRPMALQETQDGGEPHNVAAPLATTTDDSVVSDTMADNTADTVDSIPSSSNRMVLNALAHYRTTVPINWYVEKSGPTGIALYPDYDPQSGNQPRCKIEISALPNGSNLMLGDWLAAELHQDPTADIAEASQSPSHVADRNAIVWAGALNGVSTTLTYVAGDGLVYEFAPSGIKGSDCQDELETVLTNFIITTP
jgi:hypothetical protein